VGRPVLGKLHVCDETGEEVGSNQEGLVYFERRRRSFEYHNAEEQTVAVHHPMHENWAALGDVGKVDEDGYLYLTDRATFMIVSGGVNIYPQEIEDALIVHPKIADVAVIGVPNEDFGEEVKAIVQLVPGIKSDEILVDELLVHAHERLARYKVPRSIDFVTELPRLPTGKLYKGKLREAYWAGHESRIL
jgi:fatty-acyl-CoA synthase